MRPTFYLLSADPIAAIASPQHRLEALAAAGLASSRSFWPRRLACHALASALLRDLDGAGIRGFRWMQAEVPITAGGRALHSWLEDPSGVWAIDPSGTDAILIERVISYRRRLQATLGASGFP
jgi:hypothetical protein